MVPFEKEILTTEQQLNEHIMISLRTKEGLNLKTVQERWGIDAADVIRKGIVPFTTSGFLTCSDDWIELTDEGMLRADGIAAKLFV